MSDFDALLKRSFAEAPEPADDGFTVQIGHAVARREKALQVRQTLQNCGFALAGLAVGYGVYSVAGSLGPQVQALIGLELAQAQAGLGAGLGAGVFDQIAASMGAAMSYILLGAAGLAGGAVALRSAQQD